MAYAHTLRHMRYKLYHITMNYDTVYRHVKSYTGDLLKLKKVRQKRDQANAVDKNQVEPEGFSRETSCDL